MTGSLIIDIDRCVGCSRCVLACAVEHSRSGDLIGALREQPSPRSRITLVSEAGGPAVLVCVHCDDPACAAVCPAGAIEKRASGEVVVDEGRCVGCGACAVACHLGVPVARSDGRAYVTCDLCPSRREAGLQTACAEACPTGAIIYDRAAAGGNRVLYKRPDKEITIYRKMTAGLP